MWRMRALEKKCVRWGGGGETVELRLRSCLRQRGRPDIADKERRREMREF